MVLMLTYIDLLYINDMLYYSELIISLNAFPFTRVPIVYSI